MDKVEMQTFIVMPIVFILGIILLVILILGLSNYTDRVRCNQYHNTTSKQVKFIFWPSGECYVKTNNGWLLKSQIQLRSN